MARHSKIESCFQAWLGTTGEIFLKVILLSWLFTCSCQVSRRVEDEVLEQVFRCVSMPPERLNTTAQVVEDLQRVLQERWPGSKVFMFGSLVAGMGTRGSDVDCFVQLPAPPSYGTVGEARDLLAAHPQLFRRLATEPAAAVPLVRFLHAPTDHRCDVSFTDREGVVQSRLLRYLLRLDGRARRLAVLVKHWARLHPPPRARRVLPNYGLVLLVVFYLQQRRLLPPVILLQQNADSVIVDSWEMGYREIPYGSANDDSLFELLSGFFKFYARFDFENKIISPFNGTAIDRALFERLDTVPRIFEVYKRNVGLNITKPLNITTPVCIQNFFNHSLNKGVTTTQEQLDYFRSILKSAAETSTDFREHSLLNIFEESGVSSPCIARVL